MGGGIDIDAGRKRSLLDSDGEPIPVHNSEEKKKRPYEEVLDRCLHEQKMAIPNLFVDADIKERVERLTRQQAEMMEDYRRKLMEDRIARGVEASDGGEEPILAECQTRALRGQSKIVA